MEKKRTLLVARDKDADGSGEVWIFSNQPHWKKVGDDYLFCGNGICADDSTSWCFGDVFNDITFENSPVEVEITIKIKE